MHWWHWRICIYNVASMSRVVIEAVSDSRKRFAIIASEFPQTFLMHHHAKVHAFEYTILNIWHYAQSKQMTFSAMSWEKSPAVSLECSNRIINGTKLTKRPKWCPNDFAIAITYDLSRALSKACRSLSGPSYVRTREMAQINNGLVFWVITEGVWSRNSLSFLGVNLTSSALLTRDPLLSSSFPVSKWSIKEVCSLIIWWTYPVKSILRILLSLLCNEHYMYFTQSSILEYAFYMYIKTVTWRKANKYLFFFYLFLLVWRIKH